ncbi:MAG TPA: PTS system mannose/fructose/sorbose family transporter subunit IID [Gemmatimonadales bacterium]|nr:PTS system mannose/fructose/sorbose family transporter subunit IID [Gemmatimonadales bacterium]
MNGKAHALLRLFAVQGVWNYERMLGVGIGYAAEPLLEDLKVADPVRHSEAVVRSAEFFNCNPNLAGLALGATVRAEYDAEPGPQVVRLRAALCSPLGALGDQLFWAGLLPALVGAALAAVVLGASGWGIVGFLVAYNVVRGWTAVWSLRTGLKAGMGVGKAIGTSWIPKAVPVVGYAAGLSVGFALPLLAKWYLRPFGLVSGIAVALIVAAGIAAGKLFGARMTGSRFALAAVLVTLLFRLVAR